MRRAVLLGLVGLVLMAGCLGVVSDGDPHPTAAVADTPSPQPTSTTPRATTTPAPINETRQTHLETFAREQERIFETKSNLTNVAVYRPAGTARVTARFSLPDGSAADREALFERVLEALVQSQYNWVHNGSATYLAANLTVRTDYGNGTISSTLLQRYIDGTLDRATVAYAWAGQFDPYTALGDREPEGHRTRAERLEHTANVVERRMESEKPYTTDVETAIANETLFVAYRHASDTPNPTWSIGDTVRAYRETVTAFGIEYMPSNGVRGYDYHPNGSADVTFVVKNPWITSEYVGLRPTGEGSLNAANSLTGMDGPHDGPP